MAEVWQRALVDLRDQIGKQNYETWIQPITFVSRDKGRVCLNVPNMCFRDWLTEHYLTQIEEVLSKAAQQKMAVSLDVKQEPQIKTIAEKNVGKNEREREKGRRTSNLIQRDRFENFVMCAGNE